MNFRDDLHEASDWVASYLDRVGELAVSADVRPGQVRAALPASPPERGEAFADVLRDLDETILPGLTHWNHPRFFAWFSTTGSEAGILAELLIAALNVNVMTWLASPAATELEVTVVDWLAQLLGLPREWHGHLEDTASTSTLAALAAARELRPDGVVYASEQANFSVEKSVRLLGLEFRSVETDDAFRMRTDFPLDDATAVVATVGTTGTTSVDPVPELATRCEEAGVWLHVDAAYAGSAAVCPELRWCLDGCERADSVVVNPHKWLFTPIDCSVLYTRKPEVLRETFSLVPEYLKTTDTAEVNYMDYGLQLGRRFRALKLWLVMEHYGIEHIRTVIRDHVALAQRLATELQKRDDIELIAPQSMSVVVFRRKSGEEATMELLERMNASGKLFVSHTRLRDVYGIRVAIGNGATEWRHVEEILKFVDD